MRRLHLLLPLLLAAAPTPAVGDSADDPAATFAALRSVDRQLATIGERLAVANAALCDVRAPTPGWVLHALDQYDPPLRPAATRTFAFAGPVGVEEVVPGAAAARAGVRANDTLVAVAGHPVASGSGIGTGGSSATRDAALALVEAQPADKPLPVSLLRDGRRVELTLPATPGCRARFELVLGSSMEASSDGLTVRIGTRFFARYRDDEVAAVIAHELAHIVLRHRARLEAAGVKWGLLAELGRNGRLFRRTEDEADRLSVSLLRNAGYDPLLAARFWREHGGDVDGGLFRSRTHPASGARARAIEAEAAAIPANAPRPYRPPLLATRDAPLQ